MPSVLSWDYWETIGKSLFGGASHEWHFRCSVLSKIVCPWAGCAESLTYCKSPWITAQLNGSSVAYCIMFHPGFTFKRRAFQRPLRYLTSTTFSNGYKRKTWSRRCKAHSPTAQDIVLSKPAKWKHKRYQRIVNTHKHTHPAPTVVKSPIRDRKTLRNGIKRLCKLIWKPSNQPGWTGKLKNGNKEAFCLKKRNHKTTKVFGK